VTAISYPDKYTDSPTARN